MKKIEAIIPQKAVKPIVLSLNKYFEPYVQKNLRKQGYPGVTIIDEVSGRGKGHGHIYNWGGKDFEVNLFPKSKIEIIVIDDDVDEVVNLIISTVKNLDLNTKHLGKIFIYNVENAISIRDGKKGEEAIR